MMMKSESPSCVLSCGKCEANEIAALNQICSARVIECYFEKHACLRQKREHGWSCPAEHWLCPLANDDMTVKDGFTTVTV